MRNTYNLIDSVCKQNVAGAVTRSTTTWYSSCVKIPLGGNLNWCNRDTLSIYLIFGLIGYLCQNVYMLFIFCII